MVIFICYLKYTRMQGIVDFPQKSIRKCHGKPKIIRTNPKDQTPQTVQPSDRGNGYWYRHPGQTAPGMNSKKRRTTSHPTGMTPDAACVRETGGLQAKPTRCTTDPLFSQMTFPPCCLIRPWENFLWTHCSKWLRNRAFAESYVTRPGMT